MDLLREPLDIAGLTVPNRIAMPPLVIWQAGEDGLVTDSHRAHYQRSLGAGIVIVEATVVSPEGRLAATQLGLWNDSQISGLADIARMIRDSGALAGIQIHHAGGKATKKNLFGLDPVAPSLLDSSNEGTQELTDAEIERIIRDFAAAARRAVEAGFQIIEAHGAHGYLGSQFLSGRMNRREDRWGGPIENRVRFLEEVIRAIHNEVGDAAIAACRLGTADKYPDGVTVDDGIAAARVLVDAGCTLLDISNAGSDPVGLVPDGSTFDVKMHLAGLVRDAVDVPVIGVGRVRTPAEAEAVLDAGLADIVAVGRGILADPGWAQKALSGSIDEIQLCEQCKPGCFHFTDGSKCPARRKLANSSAGVA